MEPPRRPRGRARGTRTVPPAAEPAIGLPLRASAPQPGITPRASAPQPGQHVPPIQQLTLGQQQLPAASSSQSGPSTSKPTSSDTRSLEDRRKELAARNDHVVSLEPGRSKSGTAGTNISLRANYFETSRLHSWELFQYCVDFAPQVDATRTRKELMRPYAGNERDQLGFFIFDGSVLWTIRRLPDSRLEITTRHENEPMLIKLRLVGNAMPGDVVCTQIYNIIVRKCFQLLELTLMGRNYFDHTNPIQMPQHRLSLWPGFVSTLRQHDAGLLYCIELTHKVIRLDTVLDIINAKRAELNRRGLNEPSIQKKITEYLVGNIVLSHYNRRTYRVDDVDWDQNPRSTFQKKGVPVSFINYYQQRHDINIRDLRQPLLISKPSTQEIRRGRAVTDVYCLVPELCQITGLSDEMRSNFGLMKDLGQHLFQSPAVKLQNTVDFVARLRGCHPALQEMNNWGVQISPHPLQLTGRVLDRERVLFNPTMTPFEVNPQGDFTMALRNHKMVSTVPLNNWVIIVSERDAGNVGNLVTTMQRVARPLGFEIANETRRITVRNVSEYGQALTRAKEQSGIGLQMAFVILTGTNTTNMDVYATVKKKCYVDYGLPSQCFLSKNLTSKGLMSIATKLVIQMNAKLGGVPWVIAIPLKKLMIIGFDVYHGGIDSSGRRKPSIGAMVCTTTDDFVQHYSCINYFKDGNELSVNMALSVKKCCMAFRKTNNGQLPGRIIFYRDGVGQGQLAHVYDVELEAIKNQLTEIYLDSGFEYPKFSFIVVTKRINTRIFAVIKGVVDNPPPGTLVDSQITIPERWDFFLVAAHARQGVVSPTNYNVLWDRNQLDASKIQRLTYKLCHVYYNWSGTVAVPSVCQYAHKLAYLTGKVLESDTHDNLVYKLYFL